MEFCVIYVSFPSHAKKKRFGRFVDSDPINLIFDNIQLQDIENFLREASWHDAGIASDLYVNNNKQSLQLASGSLWERFHVRFWNATSNIVASAHYETFGLTGHNVHNFEGGEVRVVKDFNRPQSKKWSVERGALFIEGTENLKKFNDGYATKITKSSGG